MKFTDLYSSKQHLSRSFPAFLCLMIVGIFFASGHQALAQRSMQWVAGPTVPALATRGGSENGATLYVCRARYEGGLHSGKVVDGKCNIGWGGKEIPLPKFEILTGTGTWGRPQDKFKGVFIAGEENDQPLYLCRAFFNTGMHPGKVVAGNCNIGWGGEEKTIPNFEVFYPSLRSISDTNSVAIKFKNNTGDEVEVLWVNYNGGFKSYANLKAGESLDLTTYTTHSWIFKQNGREIARYIVTADKDQTFVVVASQRRN